MWIQEEVEIKLGVDSKCAPKEQGEKVKGKCTSQASGLRRIGWFKVGKTLYSFFIFFIVDVFDWLEAHGF